MVHERSRHRPLLRSRSGHYIFYAHICRQKLRSIVVSFRAYPREINLHKYGEGTQQRRQCWNGAKALTLVPSTSSLASESSLAVEMHKRAMDKHKEKDMLCNRDRRSPCKDKKWSSFSSGLPKLLSLLGVFGPDSIMTMAHKVGKVKRVEAELPVLQIMTKNSA